MKFEIEGSVGLIRTLAEDVGLRLEVTDKCNEPCKVGNTLMMPRPTSSSLEGFEQELHRIIGREYAEVKYIAEVDPKDEVLNLAKDLMYDYKADTCRRGILDGRDAIRDEGYSDSLEKFTTSGIPLIDSLVEVLNGGRNEIGGYNLRDLSTPLSRKLSSSNFIERLNECQEGLEFNSLLQMLKEIQEENQDEGEEEEEESGQGDSEGTEGDGEIPEGSSEGSNGDSDKNTDDLSDDSSPDEDETGVDDDGRQSGGETEATDDSEGDTEEEDEDINEEGHKNTEGNQGSGNDGSDTQEGSETQEETGEDREGDSETDEGTDDGGMVGISAATSSLENSGLIPKSNNSMRQQLSTEEPYIPPETLCIFDMSNPKFVYGGLGKVMDITHAIKNLHLSKRVMKDLMMISQSAWSANHRTGRLHNKSLSKLLTHTGAMGQPRICKRKDIPRIEKDSAVEILLDCSASMNGYKYSVGAASCILIGEVLDALQITYEIVGFAATPPAINSHYIFKGLNERHVTRERLIKRFSSEKINMFNNDDGVALTWAMERLHKRPERSKTLLMLSDGLPTSRGNGCGIADTKRVAKGIEEEGVINLCGIGILSDSVAQFYDNYTIVKDIKDLEGAILEVIKSNILR